MASLMDCCQEKTKGATISLRAGFPSRAHACMTSSSGAEEPCGAMCLKRAFELRCRITLSLRRDCIRVSICSCHYLNVMLARQEDP